jgi:hypothetical protein
MLDLMLYFVADLPENAGLSSKVEAWCKAISVSNLIRTRRRDYLPSQRFLHLV